MLRDRFSPVDKHAKCNLHMNVRRQTLVCLSGPLYSDYGAKATTVGKFYSNALPSPVLSLALILSTSPRSSVGVSISVDHVPQAVPLAVLVLALVAVAVGPSVPAGAREQVVLDFTSVSVARRR